MTTNLQDFPASDEEAKLAEEERRRQEALASLQRRFAERDELRGDVPTVAGVFPQDLAPEPVKPGLPDPYAPASPAPPVNPSSAPGDAGPPALSVSPQPPEPTAEASVNPETPTATAGAEAAAALQRAQGAGGAPGVPQVGAQAPRGPNAPPLAALGATGLDAGALTAGLGADPRGSAALIEQIREQRLEDERNAARNEDQRRRRIRGILMGIAALGGMATIGSGGSVGGALPGMLAAALVRRPDEEERLLADREREGEEAAARAEREGEEADRAWRRERAAVEDAQWGAEFGETQRTNANVDANRRQRQAIAMSAEDRAAADVARDENHPVYGDTVRGARQMFRVFTRSLPEDVQAMLAAPDVQQRIDHASPAELRELMTEYGDIESSRQRGGGGSRTPSSGAYSSSASTGGLAGAGVAPAWYVAQVAEGNERAPDQATAEDIQSANENWQQFTPEQRARLAASGADAGAETLAITAIMRHNGYEQAVGGHIPAAWSAKAKGAHEMRDTINGQVARGLRGLDELFGQGWWQMGAGLVADRFGTNQNEAIARYNSARAGVMSTLAQARGAGVIGEAEHERFMREMPDVSTIAGLIGAYQSMAQVAEEIDTTAESIIRANGYRRIEGAPRGGRRPPRMSRASEQQNEPEQRRAAAERRRQARGAPALRAGYTRLIFRDAQGRRARRDVPNDQVEATLARMPNGVTLVSRRVGVAQ